MNSPAPEQMQLLIWESTVTPAGDGRAVVTAQKPLYRMSVKQAAKVLQCGEQTVCKAFRAGLISGWKPGSVATRKDGRKSNAAIVLDAGSVLKYKESRTQCGAF
jgi:hypothetical protein